MNYNDNNQSTNVKFIQTRNLNTNQSIYALDLLYPSPFEYIFTIISFNIYYFITQI